MKKIFLSLIFLISILAVNAQSPTPRFGTTKNEDNTGRVLTYGYASPVYAASYNIAPNAYETTVKMDTLKGALTLTSSITKCHAADKLSLVFLADGTNRVVTFSTGFASGGNITVNSGTRMTVNFVFDGSTGWVEQTANNLAFGLAGDGTVGAPSIGFTSDTDNGLYRIGANHYAASAAGAKVLDISSTGLGVTGTIVGSSSVTGTSVITDAITEKTSGAGITMSKAIIRSNTATAINSTATVTAAQLAGGLLTSTSAAAVTMTLPTATALATQLGATQGTMFDFVVDNSAGANTVTIAVGSGIVASGFPGTNTLTLAASATIGTAVFRITFISTTAATLTRIN